MKEWIIRKMRPEEAEQAHRLEEQCFPDPWSAGSLADMLNGKNTLYLACFLGDRLAGYCGVQTVLDEGEILRIAVEESCRGRGIGRSLLEEVFRETPQVVNWNLDVREKNAPAVALYTGLGFVPVGRRKNYYHHPEEDAVLMQRMLQDG